jgi:putative NADH-flavin reductase
MKIAVVAANGRTGSVFVEAALGAGHEVVAGVYGSHAFQPHERLAVRTCDATSMTDVQNLLIGVDAVVSLIGHVKGSPENVQTDAMKIIVAAMQAAGIRRIVSLTGTGVRAEGDVITLLDRILNLSIGIVDPARVRDGINHVQVLRESMLDWTVVRVLKLQNVSPSPYALHLHGPTKPYVGRREVAGALLEVIEDNSYIGELPIIGNADATSRDDSARV